MTDGKPLRKPHGKTEPLGTRLLARASVLIILVAVLSKSFGLARDVLISWFFGATRSTDLFFFGFNVWIAFAFAFSLSMNQVLMPQLAKARARNEVEAGAILGSVLAVGILGASALSIAAGSFSHNLARALGPGLSSADLEMGSHIFRTLSVAVPAIVAAAVLATALRLGGQFGRSEIMAPAINAGIVAAIILERNKSVGTAAHGAVLGSLLGLFMLLYAARGLLPRLRITPTSLGFAARYAGYALVLSLVGHSGGYATTVAESALALGLPPGQLSCLAYARRLLLIVVQLIVPAVMLTGLAGMSGRLGEGDRAGAHRMATTSLRLLLFLLALPTLILVGFSPLVVTLVYGRGAFGEGSITTTSSLISILFPIPLLAIVRNGAAQIVFSEGKPGIASGVGLLGVVVFLVSGLFGRHWAGVWGLAVAILVTEICSAAFLMFAATRVSGYEWGWLGRFLARLALPVGGGLVAIALPALAAGEAVEPGGRVFLQLVFGSAGCAVAFVSVAALSGNGELREILGWMRRLAMRSK